MKARRDDLHWLARSSRVLEAEFGALVADGKWQQKSTLCRLDVVVEDRVAHAHSA